jgi:hypothetical protein
MAISGAGSGLFTLTDGRGPGGEIQLHARTIALSRGAVISAASTGSGNAGDLTLHATQTVLSDQSTVTTAATQADGGNITVHAQDMIRLRDSQVTATVSGGPQTRGGNITLTTPTVLIVQGSAILARAVTGQGGAIALSAGEAVLVDPTSRVDATASADVGIDGTVDIRAPVINLSGTVAPLPQTFAQPAVLLRQRCAERLREGQVSTLVVAGRSGLPADPEGGLPSPLAAWELPITATPGPGKPLAAPTATRTGQWQPTPTRHYPHMVDRDRDYRRGRWR